MGAGKAAGQSAAACGKAAGPFRVSGTQVLGAGSKPFVSYGLTVAGLQGPYCPGLAPAAERLTWAGAVDRGSCQAIRR